MIEKTLKRDTEHILNLLEQELGKNGKNRDSFIEKYREKI
jgi:translation initiation factor 2 beta subunit (eIF-2beta)/eIF-5